MTNLRRRDQGGAPSNRSVFVLWTSVTRLKKKRREREQKESSINRIENNTRGCGATSNRIGKSDRAQASRGEQQFKKLILSPSQRDVYSRFDVAIVFARRWKEGISLNGIVNQRCNKLAWYAFNATGTIQSRKSIKK